MNLPTILRIVNISKSPYRSSYGVWTVSSVMPRRRFAVRCGTLVNPNLFGHHLGTYGSVPALVGTHRSVPNQQEVSPQLAGHLGAHASIPRPAMGRDRPTAAAR